MVQYSVCEQFLCKVCSDKMSHFEPNLVQKSKSLPAKIKCNPVFDCGGASSIHLPIQHTRKLYFYQSTQAWHIIWTHNQDQFYGQANICNPPYERCKTKYDLLKFSASEIHSIVCRLTLYAYPEQLLDLAPL